MEEEYLRTVNKGYQTGSQGRRGIDLLTEAFGHLVAHLDDTRKDVLGDVFQGAITYGEGGQYFTSESITSLMAELTASEPEADAEGPKTVCDPCCGSGRFLLSFAEHHRNWEFVGQDIDFRCVQMTAINLGLRNLYGYVLWGNSLADERKRAFRTGFNVNGGVIREIAVDRIPEAVPSAYEDARSLQTATDPDPLDRPKLQQRLF